MPRLVLSRWLLAFTACATTGACASVTRSAPSGARTATATPLESRAAHVLNRLTFGPRPGDVERVLAVGIDRWIARQLEPDTSLDRSARTALKGCWAWLDSVPSVVAQMSVSPRYTTISTPAMTTSNGMIAGRVIAFSVATNFLGLLPRDSARRMSGFGAAYLDNGQLIACRLARLEATDHQLLEVMTDFWENHFSIYANRVPGRGSVVEWDRAVIRPRALGRFRDLLGAVARDPGMLAYLDNAVSTASANHQTLREYLQSRDPRTSMLTGQRVGGGVNENYARELLELHTLGVDGGYTQADVIDVARALTGWTHTRATVGGGRPNPVVSSPPASFRFDSSTHDADPKRVLGHDLPGGRGMEDGEQVLDILARHPSTAKFIARKLAVRFVSDSPPAALVDRAAETFRRTDGDIREVVRTIVTSPEFHSPDVYGAKVKSPLELVLSIRRALAAPPDTAAEGIDFLLALEQPPFGRLTPDGWPETGGPWVNAGAMRIRVDLAVRIANGEIPSIPVTAWPEWSRLSTRPFDAQLDGVIRSLLSGRVSAATRSTMASVRPGPDDADTPEARQLRLRELVALALASPEFQHR